MSIELTNEEKIQILNNRIKGLKSNKYNLEAALIEENVLSPKNVDTIALVTVEVANTTARIQALEAEIIKLEK
jgi:hypothetical protein